MAQWCWDMLWFYFCCCHVVLQWRFWLQVEFLPSVKLWNRYVTHKLPPAPPTVGDLSTREGPTSTKTEEEVWLFLHNKNLEWWLSRLPRVTVRKSLRLTTCGRCVFTCSVTAAYWFEWPSRHGPIMPQMALDFDWKCLQLNCRKSSFIGQLLHLSLLPRTFVRLIDSQTILPMVWSERDWFIQPFVWQRIISDALHWLQ